jgi:hypothetical protein
MSDARKSSKKNNSVLSIPRGHSLGEFRTHTEATEFVNRLIFALLIGAGFDVGADGEINYAPQEFLAVIVIAAGVGMLVNILRFLASKNKRGFLSSQMPVAARYEVIVPEEDAAKAMQIVNMARDLS